MKTFELTTVCDEHLMMIWETSRINAISFALKYLNNTSFVEVHVHEYDFASNQSSVLTIYKSAL